MRYSSLPEATLLVGSYSSYCNNCGLSANPSEKTHSILLGYGPTNGDPGCGIEWTHVFSEYAGTEAEEATKEMRPDLEFVSWTLPSV